MVFLNTRIWILKCSQEVPEIAWHWDNFLDDEKVCDDNVYILLLSGYTAGIADL